MPSLGHLECHLELEPSGIVFGEYQVEYSNSAVQSYVAVPGHSTTFSIVVNVEGYVSPGLAVYVFIDGVFQVCKRVQTGKRDSKATTQIRFSHREQPITNERVIIRGWRFEKFNIANAGSSTDLHDDVLKNLGTIEVVVLRCDKPDSASTSSRDRFSHLPLKQPSSNPSRARGDSALADIPEEEYHYLYSIPRIYPLANRLPDSPLSPTSPKFSTTNDEEAHTRNPSVSRFNGESTKPSRSSNRKKDVKRKLAKSKEKKSQAKAASSSSSPSSSSPSEDEDESSEEVSSSEDDSSEDSGGSKNSSKAKTSSIGFGGLGGLFDGQHDVDSMGHDDVSSFESERSDAPGGFDGPYECSRRNYEGYLQSGPGYTGPSSSRPQEVVGYFYTGVPRNHATALPTGPVPYMDYGGVPVYNAPPPGRPPAPPGHLYGDLGRYPPAAPLIPGYVPHVSTPYPYYHPPPVIGPHIDGSTFPIAPDGYIADASSNSDREGSSGKKRKKEKKKERASTKNWFSRKSRKKAEERKKKTKKTKKQSSVDYEDSKNSGPVVNAPGAWPESSSWTNNDDNNSRCAHWAKSVSKAGSQDEESSNDGNNEDGGGSNNPEDGNPWSNQDSDNEWHDQELGESLWKGNTWDSPYAKGPENNGGSHSRQTENGWQNQQNHEPDVEGEWDTTKGKSLHISGDGSNDTASVRSCSRGRNKNGRTKEYWSRAVEKESLSELDSSYILPAMPLYTVPADKIKDGARYQVRAGPGQQVARKHPNVNCWDSLEKPYAVFTFKYRPHEALKKKLGDKVVPEQSKEEQAAYLNSLSKSELVKLMMKNIPTADDESKVNYDMLAWNNSDARSIASAKAGSHKDNSSHIDQKDSTFDGNQKARSTSGSKISTKRDSGSIAKAAEKEEGTNTGSKVGSKAGNYGKSGGENHGKKPIGIPERTNGIPERSNGIPERSNDIPNRSNGIPERASGIPERASGIPERASGIPERASGIPERISNDTPDKPKAASDTASKAKENQWDTTSNKGDAGNGGWGGNNGW